MTAAMARSKPPIDPSLSLVVILSFGFAFVLSDLCGN